MDADAQRELREVFDAAVASVDPAVLVRRHAWEAEAFLKRMGTPRAALLSFGKAAVSMARGACDVLGERCGGGLLVSTAESIATAGDLPAWIERVEAEHPVPGVGSVRGGEGGLRLASSLSRGTALLCLVSGGGSALLCVPAPEILLDEKRRATDLLLRGGADIVEMNTVRKHLSAIKGGQLAVAAHPAPVLTLVLSDVVGDPVESIASGPTSPDRSTFEDAERVLRRLDLLGRVPASVRRRIAGGVAGEIAETPKPGDHRLERTEHRIIGSNGTALEAARRFVEARGVMTRRRPDPVVGEVRDAGRALAIEARIASAQRMRSEPPLLLLSGGETTVTVRGDGRGGRSTELALAFAIEIAGTPGVRLLAAGTDGIDGGSDAAGAYADGGTLDRARAMGIDPAAALDRNDSAGFFEALGDLFRTGPTGTNVMDLQLVRIGP